MVYVDMRNSNSYSTLWGLRRVMQRPYPVERVVAHYRMQDYYSDVDIILPYKTSMQLLVGQDL